MFIETLADVPADFKRIMRRALEHDPERRYPDAGALAHDLAACHARQSGAGARWSVRDRRLAWIGAATLVVLAAISFWLWRDRARTNWARTVALPDIERWPGNESASWMPIACCARSSG